jgi:hypothetical protein
MIWKGRNSDTLASLKPRGQTILSKTFLRSPGKTDPFFQSRHVTFKKTITVYRYQDINCHYRVQEGLDTGE